MKERTEKELVKMLLEEEDSSIQMEQNCFGLSISNDIIREMGGTICFKSMVDVGASFSISIPLDKSITASDPHDQVFPVKSHNMNDSCNLVTIDDDDLLFNQLQNLRNKAEGPTILDQKETQREKKKIFSERKQERPKAQNADKKIMLINNDQNELDQIQFFFNMLGLDNAEERVTLCKSGAEALQIFQDRQNRSQYKLILIECNMPVMSGMDTALKMREFLHEVGVSTTSHPEIYGFTCQYDRQLAQRASVCGMKDVYSKPVQLKVLAQLLYKLRLINSVPDIKIE